MDAIHGLLHRIGIDVVRYPGRVSPIGRRMRLLRHHAIDVVLDVGANRGQYAQELRAHGYRGRIISFEPLPEAFQALGAAASRDDGWTARQVALGDIAGTSLFHVAGNRVSSSFLPMLEPHLRIAPESAYVRDLPVEIVRLDSILDDLVTAAERPYLKIDVQGFERQVLVGASGVLPRIVGVQVELSLEHLYEGAPTISEMVEYLGANGFWLASIEPGFLDVETGRQLQVDGLFFRQDAVTSARRA